MAKNKNNTVAPETTVVSTPKLTLEEKLDKLCSGFLGGLQDIMDEAMSNTRNARDNMMDAVAVYRKEVGKQDVLAGVILDTGKAIVHAGEQHIAEVETYENTLGILADLEDEIAGLDEGELDEDDYDDEDEILDEVDTTDAE